MLVKCAEPFDPGHSNFLDWFYLLLLHLRIDTKTVVSLMFSKLRLLTFECQLLLLAVIQKYLVLFVFVLLPIFFLVHSHLLQFKLIYGLRSSSYIQILSRHLVQHLLFLLKIKILAQILHN